MQTGFTIRTLANADTADIVELILPIQQIEFNLTISIDDQPDLLDIEKYYLDPGGSFWGCVREKELVGTTALLSIGRNYGVIRKMFVKKEFRGKEFGIAQVLLDTLIGYAAKEKLSGLYLGTIDVMKTAQRFYERNGFSEIEKNKLPPDFPLMKKDNLFYHKTLLLL